MLDFAYIYVFFGFLRWVSLPQVCRAVRTFYGLIVSKKKKRVHALPIYK